MNSRTATERLEPHLDDVNILDDALRNTAMKTKRGIGNPIVTAAAY